MKRNATSPAPSGRSGGLDLQDVADRLAKVVMVDMCATAVALMGRVGPCLYIGERRTYGWAVLRAPSGCATAQAEGPTSTAHPRHAFAASWQGNHHPPRRTSAGPARFPPLAPIGTRWARPAETEPSRRTHPSPQPAAMISSRSTVALSRARGTECSGGTDLSMQGSGSCSVPHTVADGSAESGEESHRLC